MTDFHSRLEKWRHHLHQNPELGFEEKETSDFIARQLDEFGIPATRGIGKTGLVGIVEGRPGRKAIALRADMDALPIQERSGKPYASKVGGKMHACGHDGHIAMLLGAAQRLSEARDFSGTVVLIFQPAEETGGGARVMIEDGLFDRFRVNEVYGLHNWPGLEEGQFAIRSGAVMAASDRFDITIAGRSCHAAMPQQGRDPIVGAAQIVSGLQHIVSRAMAPWESAVVSVTRFEAGNTYNVIPDAAYLAGTLRSLNKTRRKALKDGLKRIVRNVAAAHELHAEITIHPGYPVTVNTERESFEAACAAGQISPQAVLDDRPASMATEDFAYMLEKKPGCYAWLGSGTRAVALHNDAYDFNDALLTLGVDYWLKLVERRLKT